MYYLQIILGTIILTAIAVPLSNNYKAIKIKNIIAAMGAMVLFGFILLNPYVAGFFEVISAGVTKLSSATAEGTTFVFGSLFYIHLFYWLGQTPLTRNRLFYYLTLQAMGPLSKQIRCIPVPLRK